MTLQQRTTRPYLAMLLTFWIATANAADSGAWEFYGQISGIDSGSSAGQNGSGIDVDSQVGWGFGGSYYLNRNLALGFTGTFWRPSYTATYNTEEDGLQTLSHRASIFSGRFNGTYGFGDGPLTPFVTAGLGWTYIDSNVANGPPTTGCWWDPWWGYVCQSFFSTYQDTQFSYNAGVGVRYDFTDAWFVRGIIDRTWLESNADGAKPSFDAFRVEIGVMTR